MTRRTFWGFAALILLILGAFVVVTIRDRAEIRQLKKEAAEAKKLEKELTESKKLEKHMNQQPDVNNKPPREARAGHRWEWHGDHWHEMPTAQNDVPQQEPASEKIVFAPVRKLNFPDKIPEKFPTEAELRQMDGEELLHLARLYTKASNELRKTDRDAGIRLYNAAIPILYKIMDEKNDRIDAIMEEIEKEHRKEFPIPRYHPATEESPAVYIDTKPRASNEGGKQ